MSKHIPGPWLQHPNGLGGRTTEIWVNDAETPEKGTRIAKHVHGVHNARLISAAPELLEALERIATDFRGISNPSNALRDIARAAIAKATGEA